MIINHKSYRTVWMKADVIYAIDQTKLPESFEIISLNNVQEVADAIKDMIVRGAPAIGALGAYGLAQAAMQATRLDQKTLRKVMEFLLSTRPTAYDLTHALDSVFLAVSKIIDDTRLNEAVYRAAEDYVDRSVDACKRIGELGQDLIRDGDRILTHCNAGALATVDYGTALACIRMAHYAKKEIFVFVDETRPLLQGAKLTAWELQQENIPYTVITDNAAGYYMHRGEIDLVITGADRVAANGDAANKIGTYEKAVLAHENGLPFYIAAPTSTIDFHIPTGEDIPIEERDEMEVHMFAERRITPVGSQARNPAFDVTPAKFISAIITDKGIFKPEEIVSLNT